MGQYQTHHPMGGPNRFSCGGNQPIRSTDRRRIHQSGTSIVLVTKETEKEGGDS